jgi:hypothetical protein
MAEPKQPKIHLQFENTPPWSMAKQTLSPPHPGVVQALHTDGPALDIVIFLHDWSCGYSLMVTQDVIV